MKTKLLSLILAAFTVCMTLASCAEQTDGEGQTATSSVIPTVDESADELVRQLYGARDYGGRKFRILAVGAGSQWYNLIGPDANEVWFEDARSARAKFALLEEFGLLGLGYWNFMRPFAAGFSLQNYLFSIP